MTCIDYIYIIYMDIKYVRLIVFRFVGIIEQCMWATRVAEYFHGACANNPDARSPIIG